MDNYLTEILESDRLALQSGTTTIETKIIVKSNEEGVADLILTEKDSIKNWTHTDERYNPNEGFIGQFIARTLEGELQNVTDDFNIENKEIELYMGIANLGIDYDYLSTEKSDNIVTEEEDFIVLGEVTEKEANWYKLGTFIVNKPEDNEVSDNTTFIAMDKTILFNAKFNPDYTNTEFPESFNSLVSKGAYMSAKRLAQYTCAQVNVEFMSKSFNNDDFEINSNQFTPSNSCRDVMKAIAQLAYGWVRIGWDDICYIDEIEITAENIPTYNVITNNEYYSLTTQKQEYGPINRVSVGMSNVDGESVFDEDPISVEAVGKTNELAIYDNPLTYTTDLRNKALVGANKLFGLSYIPLETETIGHPWLKGNELIKIVDMEGNEKYTHVFNRVLKYTGHIKTDLSAIGETETEKTNGYNKTLYKDLKDVSITVNKHEGEITILNSTTDALEEGMKSVEKRLEMTVTDAYTKTEVQEIVRGLGVDGVVVESVKSAAGTFDMNGLTVEQSGASTKTNINANGMRIHATDGVTEEPLLTVDSTGVIGENIRVNTYLNIGEHSRIEDYYDPSNGIGTGVFWIGDDD